LLGQNVVKAEFRLCGLPPQPYTAVVRGDISNGLASLPGQHLKSSGKYKPNQVEITQEKEDLEPAAAGGTWGDTRSICDMGSWSRKRTSGTKEGNLNDTWF
jgi:hypothetical protein